MPHDMLPFEDVLRIVQRRHIRLVGYCAVGAAAGVTTCAVHTAVAAVRSGFRTLFLDASVGDDVTADGGWHPGSGRSGVTVLTSSEGFDFARIDNADGRREPLNNLAAARAALLHDFEDYELILVDLPPALEGRKGAVSPMAAAAICEGVFLLCRAGIETRHEVEAATERLRFAGARLEGVILNEAGHRTPGQALAARAERWARLFPGLSSRVARAARRSELLN